MKPYVLHFILVVFLLNVTIAKSPICAALDVLLFEITNLSHWQTQWLKLKTMHGLMA